MPPLLDLGFYQRGGRRWETQESHVTDPVIGRPPFEVLFARARPQAITVPDGYELCTLCKGNMVCIWSPPGGGKIMTVSCIRCNAAGYHPPGYREGVPPSLPPAEDPPAGRKIVM